MKKITVSILMIVFAVFSADAEFYRVKLTDKGPGKIEVNTPKYKSIMQIMSSRAIQRRWRDNEVYKFQEEDVPVYKPYKDGLLDLGVKIHLESRWFNYLVIECDPSITQKVTNLDYIDTLMIARHKATSVFGGISEETDIPTPVHYNPNLRPEINNEIYEISIHQNEHIGARALHDMGYFGQGIRIGVLDGGFHKIDTLPYHFKNIIANRDFIRFVSDADSMSHSEGGIRHGSQVLSIMNAERDSLYMGIATGAEYMLARSETTSEESHLELDAMVSAIEWLEAEGCDIITASLGYWNMDDVLQGFEYSEINGTSLVAKAYDMAYERGILMLNAAGNHGPTPNTISTPSDAKNVLSIGALDRNGNVTGFSSRGPLFNGDMRPHLTAFGKDVATYDAFNKVYVLAGGTSFATPVVAASAALIWSGHPSLHNIDLRKRLIEKAAMYDEPDNNYGYGLPNLEAVEASLDYSIGDLMYFIDAEKQKMICFARTRPQYDDSEKQLRILFAGEDEESIFTMEYYTDNREEYNYYSSAEIPISKFKGKPAKAYMYIEDNGKYNRKPFYHDGYITIDPNGKYIPNALDPKYLPPEDSVSKYVLEEEVTVFPNPAGDFLNIHVNTFTRSEIYSVEGALLGKSNANRIDISYLATGVYFVKIYTLDSIEFIKFIKR